MSISSLNSNTSGQTGQASAASQSQNAGYSAQTSRNQLNQLLVESLNVSISSGKQSQTLLFKASMININQVLSSDYANSQSGGQAQGSESLQFSETQLSITIQQQNGSGSDSSASASDDDTSPDATSKRILGGALSMFGLYQQQHPEMSTAEQAQNFVSLVRQGFEQGYQEATGVLKNLNVFNGDTASGIQQTHDLVEKGFDAFLKQYQDSSSTQTTSTQGSGS
ncbi:DUF5610 domain-containing protein [Chromobacterium sp. IIBBL 290-4]|uniref:DUF5610 domain-containing protein n=1 Tax=Chromobacterium sp. IIBBL 290-4 TaxID=2953890 RepID=UPI0020B6B869|nr:DUF5610 domain-containing protein [Chromobacterium sp. IIBBL 290-4]UTH73127.1 DUF5610 domain-containing protein [Chromobacterium sp. IIBBL 290-4]